MVLGLLLRDEDERHLSFDFEMLLPEDGDDRMDGGERRNGAVVGVGGATFGHQAQPRKISSACPFRHVPDEKRVECAFYKQGFCSHGCSCRYRHIKLAREECPETADFALQSKVADEENVKRRKAQPVNEFFKIAICKHWEKMGIATLLMGIRNSDLFLRGKRRKRKREEEGMEDIWPRI
ncbi:Zinc finger, CCCH-type [Phytophthora cactorum]|nr:Zinc finger, CCCH-type [Phytophthora cactorum]